ARSRGSVLPAAGGAERAVNELALAVFAAERDMHVVTEPRDARFARFRGRFDAAAYEARLAASGFRFVGRSDVRFPGLLRSIHDPPPGLFLRGSADAELLGRPAVAVVGARSCSGYGATVARALGRDLAARGRAVSSGSRGGLAGGAPRGAPGPTGVP